MKTHAARPGANQRFNQMNLRPVTLYPLFAPIAARAAAMLSRPGLWRLSAFVVACALLPALFRVVHMAENDYKVLWVDLRGLATDLGVGLLAGALLLQLRRFGLIAVSVGSLVWLLVNVGYYEFLRMFGSPYALGHIGFLGDPTFVDGSATSVSHPGLVAALAFLALAAVFLLRPVAPPRGRWVVLAAVLAIAPHIIPGNAKMSEWRQTDFVTSNIRDVVQRNFSGGSVASSAHAASAVWPKLKADLHGAKWLGAKGRPNVLLVFIEGISGAHIPSLAQGAGLRSDVVMPRLDGMAANGVMFRRFVTLQNQSNSGVYAALCGDLPQFVIGVPKMTQVANGAPRPCLPAFLGNAGYATAFVKSANSNFMQMREFGLKVGFDRVYGEEAAPPDLPRGKWGLTDDGLYRVALDEIDRFESREQPWFLTLFTSGTHHPFAIPADAVVDGTTPRQRAWDFADRSIADFVATLRDRGVLDDTLVIITSDEASKVEAQGPRADENLWALPENWGFVLALAPGARNRTVDTYFAQSDIALSVLDYLGIAGGIGQMAGRSLFRDYSSPREIVFAAVYQRRVHLFDTATGELTRCSEALTDCQVYRAPDGDLFSSKMRAVRELAEAPERLRDYRDFSIELPPLPPTQ
jgi:phosphoglycerol transferase MdoB-like AlkP superfamily enzyme